MESKAQRFLRKQVEASRAQGGPAKEPAAAEGTSSGLTLGELSGVAFVNAYEEFCQYLATDYTAPAGHASTVEQFTRDAKEFGWRFTPAGELIEEGKEPA